MGHQAGDFSEFYRSAWAPCLRAVAAWTGDIKLAEDLVSEAFAKAWADWARVSSHPAPQAWVVRTALNTGVSWWRRRRREVHLGREQPDGGAPASRSGAVAPGPAWVAESDRPEDLMAAVMHLPLRERQVVALRIYLDLDTGATASQLGIAPGTVRAHLARAVSTLRRQAAASETTEVTECATTR